jgi:tol-pal system protein YbgF
VSGPRVAPRAWSAALVAATLALGCLAPAHALFSDDEARKAILELRNRVQLAEEQNRARLAELTAANAQLSEQVAALRRSLLDLNNQLEASRAEVARLRGSDEQLTRELAELQRRQKDLAQGLDERMRRMEPVKVTLDGREFAVDPEEKRGFEEAMALLRGGEFDSAVTALAAFQRRWPSSGYTDAARFWQANALYGKRDYRGAIAGFRAFLAAAPDHPRAPEAMLAIANSQAEMKDPKAARKTIEDLVKAYPRSEAAQAGRERLAVLR